jgi:threonine dehydrogenase-like Zn-dependent dehydrogenase
MGGATMRAALLSAPGAIEVVTRDVPSAGPGEVVVRAEATSICGSDLSAYRGVHPWIKPPTILGHECAGTVVSVGEGVADGIVGTLVCIEPNICCGTCRYCRAGLPNICPDYRVLGESADLPGGMAEYVAVPAGQVYALPPAMSAEEGALVQPLAISYEGVERGQVQRGERVLVVGGGPIGLGAMLVSRVRGAEVMVIDLLDYRLDLARNLGADNVKRADDPDLDATVLEWTDGYGVDVAVEAVGGAQHATAATAQRLTAPRGRIVVLGSFEDKVFPFPLPEVKKREQVLLGSHGHPRTFAPVIDLVADGSLRPRELITHTVGLEDVPSALRLIDERADGVMKVVVKQS